MRRRTQAGQIVRAQTRKEPLTLKTHEVQTLLKLGLHPSPLPPADNLHPDTLALAHPKTLASKPRCFGLTSIPSSFLFAAANSEGVGQSPPPKDQTAVT